MRGATCKECHDGLRCLPRTLSGKYRNKEGEKEKKPMDIKLLSEDFEEVASQLEEHIREVLLLPFFFFIDVCILHSLAKTSFMHAMILESS